MRALGAGTLVLLSPLLVAAALASDAPGGNCPRFRGPHASGILESGAMPVAWDVEKKAGVAWRVPVPGLAHSSPIVWGDSVFVTSTTRFISYRGQFRTQ